MEKERGFKVIAVIALLVAVVGLTIGYAAYSSTLNITGSANVDPASWSVYFDYETGNSLTGTKVGNAIETTAPTLTSTSVSGFDVTLKAPGDSVAYNFMVKNAGTLPAKLSVFTMGNISCAPATGSNATQEEANSLCSALTYTLNYTDTSSAPVVNETLTNGTSKELVLKLEWPSGSTLIVSDDVDVTIGTTTFTYVQA